MCLSHFNLISYKCYYITVKQFLLYLYIVTFAGTRYEEARSSSNTVSFNDLPHGTMEHGGKTNNTGH